MGDFTDAFPSELQIAARYGVSRNTAREAVRRLRGSGKVIAGRGRRPRLAASPLIEAPLGALYSLLSSVSESGMSHKSVVRNLEICTCADAANQLGLPVESELFHLERLRLADDTPLALDHVWCPATFAQALTTADFTQMSFYDALARYAGLLLSGGEETFSAVIPSHYEASVLQVGPEVAALRIERLGYVNSEPFEWRETLIRGDRFVLSSTMREGLGYHLQLAERAKPDASSAPSPSPSHIVATQHQKTTSKQ